MNKNETKKRIAKLRKELDHHRYLYHVLDKQEISDGAWDSLKHELYNLEKKYPEFITPDSPTQRVGGDPLKKFVKIRHPQPMLSIEDVFNFQELQDWEDYMGDYLKKNLLALNTNKSTSSQVEPVRRFDYFCERKIDGVDIILTYKKGILVTGVTRGNGKVGEDVTQNIKTIEAIPLRLEKIIDIVVRGEIFMHQKDFKKLNQQREKQGLPIYANPRNVTAGSIRQLDSKITAKRALDCYVFEIITDLKQKTHEQVHQMLKQLGFKTDYHTRICSNLEKVKKYYKTYLTKRLKNSFDYDGVVVVLNEIYLQRILKAVGKSPRWMRAYKFPGQQTTTIVKDIVVQIGRTGALTPVALLKPVQIMGSIVSRVTLHNQDEIDRLDVRIKDTIIIEKAGDIIPAVVRVLKNLRTEKAKKFRIPKKCPFCHGPVRQKPNEVAHYCLNKKCFAIQEQKISHFVGKKGLDIEGMGIKIVKQLMEQGLIKDAADIFTLTRGDLEPLQRFAQKSADNLIKAIEQSKKIDLPHFIQALGIRHTGEQTSFDLAQHFIEFKKLKQTNKEILMSLPDLGPIASKSIIDWFKDENNQRFLKRLEKSGVKIKRFSSPIKQTLKSKNFVITGVLKSMSRERAKEKIKALGGKTPVQISKQTDFLVSGQNPGSKYDKAKRLGIKIIQEREFLAMLK